MPLNTRISIQSQQHQKILSNLADKMLLFGKVCIPNMFTAKSPPFHHDLVNTFQDKAIPKVNIIAPRGHAKSSISACLFPLHHIMFSDEPVLIVLCSKTEGHAVRLLQTIKDVLDYSMQFRSIFGYWGEHSAKTWKNNEIVLKDNTMITCKGTGQHIRGIKHGNQRPTLIIIDDPEDETNTKTAEAMEANLRWLLQSPVPALDARRGRIIVIGTPQHERCIVEVLKEMEGWVTLKYKAIQDDGKSSLWPDLWPIEKLLAEKASLESINRVSSFYREYQCEIIGEEDQLFKEKDIRYWKGDLRTQGNGDMYLQITHLDGKLLAIAEDRPVNVFMGVDPASSTSQTADYSAIMPIAIDKDMNRFVLTYYRKHVKPLTLAEAVISWFHIYKPMKTRIESVGYQEMLREYVRSKEYIPGLEIKENPRTAKSNRLETLEPIFSSRKFYMKEEHRELKDELLLYPRGKHDDLLDALYYANKGCYRPNHVVERSIQGFKQQEEENDVNSWMSV